MFDTGVNAVHLMGIIDRSEVCREVIGMSQAKSKQDKGSGLGGWHSEDCLDRQSRK